MEWSPPELRKILTRVAGEAAGFLRDKFGSINLLEVHGVKARDETMRIDLEVENYVFELLKAEGLKCLVATEERGVVKLGNDPVVIVLDPLDGSKNFASFVPWAAVSLAAAPINNTEPPRLTDIVAGAVAPIFNWPVISFAKGEGVHEGEDKPLMTPTRRLLLYYAENAQQALIVEKLIEALKARGMRVSARSLGSASLEVSWAGIGRALAFIDVRGKLRTIDITAAVHIALEAGSYVIVERWGARIDRVEEVGTVIVAPPDTWGIVKSVLCETGHCNLVDQALSRKETQLIPVARATQGH
ncbi:inositol monophosphatase [Pyrolobus fumarii 1A]|uniref:Inositol monophosphatase n=1 Tax=Pyrolobus fumarii (strain DSM 11204 / 1A) TaxID=694429 RepID=G0EH97_PYRF1|nr:inositol monophosphatase family protein [Pyrolobus fumarii]AEM39321.1 inositol monophosphatase [Pyrolobus fumarii 1A]